MKRFFFPALVAALCGIQCALASPVATKAYVKPLLKASDIKTLTPIQPQVAKEYFNCDKAKKNECPKWYYLMIPYELRGKGQEPKNGKIDYPLYVDELNVHVYILFDMGRNSKKGTTKYIRLDKEISYVDIMLPDQDKAEKKGLNKSVNAAVFFSPADMAKLSAEIVKESDKVEKVSQVEKVGERIAAVAVEFFHKGIEVTDLGGKGSDEYKKKGIVANGASTDFTDYWWRKEKESVIQMRDISETPFAPFYSQAFPPTAKLYGGAGPDKSGVPAAEGDTDGGYVPATATEGTSSEEPDTGKSSSKKNRKKNRNR